MNWTIRLTKYYGMNARTMLGSDRRNYVTCVVWYRRAPGQLGYLYFGFPITF